MSGGSQTHDRRTAYTPPRVSPLVTVLLNKKGSPYRGAKLKHKRSGELESETANKITELSHSVIGASNQEASY